VDLMAHLARLGIITADDLREAISAHTSMLDDLRCAALSRWLPYCLCCRNLCVLAGELGKG
jgi:hypothetical protein